MTLATVTIVLMVVASRTPRRIRKANAQTPIDDSPTDRSVSPSPRAGTTAPTVEPISTQ
jgi:hypothetical protein